MLKTNISNLKRLEGKVAVVTGGARGIGEAIVRLFVHHGAWVLIADIDGDAGTKLAGELTPRATFTHCDVSVESEMEATVNAAVKQFGSVDVMVNNAGVGSSQMGRSIADLDPDDFLRVLRVNVLGPALGMKHAARVMIPRKKGSIMSLASVAGIIGGIVSHSYTSSKHAVVGLTKNAAAELGRHGIRVNAISPFEVGTRMAVNAFLGNGAGKDEKEAVTRVETLAEKRGNLKGVYLRVNDVAEAALYLASEDSAYVSGHNLVIDGGVSVVYNKTD